MMDKLFSRKGDIEVKKIPLEKIQKILIVKMSSIGDVIHALPTLEVLRKNFPKAHIAWVVEPKSYDIVRGHPHLDEVILLDLDAVGKKLKKPATFTQGIKEIGKLAKKIRESHYDLVLDLQGLLKSGLISFFSKAPFRLVSAKSREGSSLFATQIVPVQEKSLHAVQKCLDLLRFLGLPVEENDDSKFTLAVLPEDEKFAQKFLASSGVKEGDTLIGLNPGAAWPTKQWPTRSFAALGDILMEKYGYKVVIFGGPGDIPLVQEVVSQMNNQPIIAGGKTSLKELAALIKKCKIFIGNDTGPMHLAIAVQTPVIALFGPTNHIYTGPYGPKKLVVTKNLECAPCFEAKKCPQNRDVECMKAIQPEEILIAIKTFL